MWSTQYSAETSATPAAVRAVLKDLHSGKPLSERRDKFELHGPFAVGTELSVTPQGQETLRSRIVELVENEVYADETEFEGLVLRFRHSLARRDDGGTRITHELVIAGDGADEVGPELGPQTSADFPVTMDDLVKAAERAGAEVPTR